MTLSSSTRSAAHGAPGRALAPIIMRPIPMLALAPIPKTGADTIAVPPAAVDTTTNRAPGQPSSTGAAGKATGVDTPITRRMGSPSVKRPSP